MPPVPALDVAPAAMAIGGPPSPASIFAIHAGSDILARVRGTAQALAFNYGAELDLAAVAGGAGTILFFDVPDAAARAQLVQERDVPILVVADDFATTVTYCMAARQLGLAAAVRFVSHSFACLEALKGAERIVWLPLRADVALADWLDRLAEAIGIDAQDWLRVRDQMLQDYASFATLESAQLHFVHMAREAFAQPLELDHDARTMLESLAADYRFGATDAARWPEAILLDARPPYPAVEGTIDLTGPARVLTFGPYMHLPPGRWRARYGFTTRGNAALNRLEFDIVADGEVKFSQTVWLDANGRFGFDCEFTLDDPSYPVEFRCLLIEGAIDGELRPVGVSMMRQPPTPDWQTRQTA